MMNGERTHDELRDLVAALALGVLGAAEANEARAHLANCAECRREYDELRPVANLVGTAVDDESAPDELTSRRMKAALLKAVAAETPTPSSAPIVRRSAALVAALAALLVLAVLSGGAIWSLSGALQTANRERATTEAIAAAAADPRGERFPVAGGTVVRNGNRLIIALRNVKPLPPGKVYEVWTQAKGRTEMAPSVTFIPAGDGVALVEVPGDAADYAAVAVSVEPAGGSTSPTSTPTFVRPLS